MGAPHQNRVTATGDIVAIPLRGAWTGNRGCVHRGHEIVRPWASHHWLVCALHYKDWHQEQWVPGRLTWLFFHDEAVAFAAGHRPCGLCRRASYNAFREAADDSGERLGFDELDRRLHAERVDPASRRRRLHTVAWSELPDGAFVLLHGQPAVVHGRELVAWGRDGYGRRQRRPRRDSAQVITPPTTLAVLRAGYSVQIDVSVPRSTG
jgi:hypothetical protein